MKTIQRIAVLLAFSVAAQSAQEVDLVGTWKLVRFVNFIDGEAIHPFGESPMGYFTYTSDGHVTIQIQNEVPPSSWKSLEPRDDGFGAESPWYVGYFGRYTVDLEAGEVIHHVEGGSVLHYIGTDQHRPFTLSGDTLVIGEAGIWERELVRID